jgi:regulatory protein
MRFTPEQSISKIKNYCAWQERCHAEVRDKLYSYGLNTSETEQLLSELIAENYLNEERFAIQYAGGKFRMKQWGKNKIRQALKTKQVSDYCIKKALAQIDADAYYTTFQKLVAEKLKSLSSEKNHFIRKKKLRDFLLQKGFESDLVNTEIFASGTKAG